MKLSYNVSSPYVRRISLLAAELGISEKIEHVTCIPYTDKEFRQRNPGGTVPSLELADGTHLYDSLTIGFSLDQTFGSGAMMRAFSSGDVARLKLYAEVEALQQGLVKLRQDVMRGAERPVDWYIERYRETALAVARTLDAQVDALKIRDFISIAAIAAIGMMEFRFPEIDWRGVAPNLAAWYDAAEAEERVGVSFPRDL